jgi:abhydrolase domain-containing protein 14
VDLGDGASVSYIEVTPDAASSSGGSPSADAGAGDPAPVVFLHGAAYDAAVWQRLGLLDDVAGLGRRAIALDLPDRGGSEGDVDEEWLSAALDALGIDRAIIVAPSMSGQMALPLLAMHADRFAGFVPVAPVGGGEFTWPGGEAPPTAVVLGAEDDSFADSTRALAAEIPDATLVVVDDAGHAAYEDDPAAFLDALEGVLGR